MTIEIRPLFSAESGSIPLDVCFDLSQVEIGGYCPLTQPVRFVGGVYNRSGVVILEGTATNDYTAPCDRCGEPATETVTCEIAYVLVESLSGEERDDYIVVDNGLLDLEDVVCTDVLLAQPTKHLCSEDCKGLCMNCGANLNLGDCPCPAQQNNPFAEALADFFD